MKGKLLSYASAGLIALTTYAASAPSSLEAKTSYSHEIKPVVSIEKGLSGLIVGSTLYESINIDAQKSVSPFVLCGWKEKLSKASQSVIDGAKSISKSLEGKYSEGCKNEKTSARVEIYGFGKGEYKHESTCSTDKSRSPKTSRSSGPCNQRDHSCQRH